MPIRQWIAVAQKTHLQLIGDHNLAAVGIETIMRFDLDSEMSTPGNKHALSLRFSSTSSYVSDLPMNREAFKIL
jgi:hypothetical protein